MGNPKHTEVSVARQSPQRPDADEPELDETDGTLEEDGTVDDVEEEEVERPSARDADRSLWDEVRIDPVEIALPSGTGYTLRAYRPARELTPPTSPTATPTTCSWLAVRRSRSTRTTTRS